MVPQIILLIIMILTMECEEFEKDVLSEIKILDNNYCKNNDLAVVIVIYYFINFITKISYIYKPVKVNGIIHDTDDKVWM